MLSPTVMRVAFKAMWALLRETYAEWSVDKATRLAAALAYYTTLSLAPLLIVVISVAGVVFGHDAVQGELVGQLAALTGREGASAIEDLLANARRPTDSLLATIIGVVTLLVGATGVVWQLKDALNTIWDVPDSDAGFGRLLRERVASFALVLGVGFLLLASLVVSATLAAAGAYLRTLIPGSETAWLALTFLVSLAVETVLFAMIFKLLPDVRVRWRDVWIGAGATAVFFEIGKLLVGLYLGRAGIGSAYGAAGSFVVVLVWVYYAAQILLFGAEFTQVYARRQASRLMPKTGVRPPPRIARQPAVVRSIR